MNILVLYSELMPYTLASLQRLQNVPCVKLRVVHWSQKLKTPYKPHDSKLRLYSKDTITNFLSFALREKPDFVYVSGRMDRDYLEVCRYLKFQKKSYIIAGFDTPFQLSIQTVLKVTFRRRLYHNYFDTLWVCGPRQERFANLLGFNDPWKAVYSADVDLFSKVRPDYLSKRLLFIGRLDKVKNVTKLITAFREQCQYSKSDWILDIIGTGPLEDSLKTANEQSNNVKFHGFKSQLEIIEIMGKVSAFVLPSSWEPFGVVVHEAAVAGLPMILSSNVGSSDYFLEHERNGYLFSDDLGLRTSLNELFSKSPNELENMGIESRKLSVKIDSDNWKNSFLSAHS